MQNFLNMDVIITLIVWIVFSFMLMSYASSKGRSGCGWFIFSIMFSPLIGFIIVAILGETDEQHIETLKKDMAVTEALEKEKSEKEGMSQEKAIAELKKAKDLLDLAVITQEEYDAKKAELIKDVLAPYSDMDEFQKKVNMLMKMNQADIITNEEYSSYKNKLMSDL